MGSEAERSVRVLCDNEAVVRQHLELHSRLKRKATRAPLPVSDSSRRGFAVVASLADARKASSEHPELLGAVVVKGGVQLSPEFVSTAEGVLRRNSNVGVMTCWIQRGPGGELDAVPAPLTVQSQDLESVPCFAVRAEAIKDLAGWGAVTYPAVLASIPDPPPRAPQRFSAFAMVVQRGSSTLALQWFAQAPWGEKLRWLQRALRDPRRIARWAIWQLRRDRTA
jgi:hypothetical protein